MSNRDDSALGDYIILKSNTSTNEYTFQEEVNAKIKEGYLPIGGVSVVPYTLMDCFDESVTFYQAMYKAAVTPTEAPK